MPKLHHPREGSQQHRRGSPGSSRGPKAQPELGLLLQPTLRDQTRASSEPHSSGAFPGTHLPKSCWDRPPQEPPQGTSGVGHPQGPPAPQKTRAQSRQRRSKHNPRRCTEHKQAAPRSCSDKHELCWSNWSRSEALQLPGPSHHTLQGTSVRPQHSPCCPASSLHRESEQG